MIKDLPALLALAELFDHLENSQVWVKDRQGRYCWVNRAFLIAYDFACGERTTAVSLDDIIGKTDYDLSPPFLADQFRLDDELVLTGQRIVNRIELVGHPDGLTAWNVTNKIPLRAADGKVIGTAGITRRLNLPERDIAAGHEFGAVLAHLRDHYHEPITNQELARLAHMSVRAFERKFLRNFHVTPQKYLRKLRLNMASRALVYTSRPLAEVGLTCGFADQSHFTREFRRQFGRTPRDYREHYHSGTAPAASGTKTAGRKQSQLSSQE